MRSPRLWTRLRDTVLHQDAAELPRWRRVALFSARVVVAVAADFVRGRLPLRAMSLVYITLLALIPLLALSLSVLQAFGVHGRIESILVAFLTPLGRQGQEFTTRVLGLVENVQVGVLSTVGLALLFYTGVVMMQNIENAFNDIWKVRRPRSFVQRFSHYLTVLLVGPVLLFSALGVTASVYSSETIQALTAVGPLGEVIDLAVKLVPYLLIIVAFTFLYLLVPNTRVRLISATTGGVCAGVLWQSTGWIFAAFVASLGQYAAVYSTLASLIVFMIWLFLSWLILLIGASVAHYHQHPSRLLLFGESPRLSMRMLEHVGLCIMAVVAERHYARAGAITAETLADRLELPPEAIAPALEALVGPGLLRQLGGAGGIGYVPATPLDETTTAEVLAALRRHGETPALRPEAVATPPAVRELLRQMADGTATGATLRSLAGSKSVGETAVRHPRTGRG